MCFMSAQVQAQRLVRHAITDHPATQEQHYFKGDVGHEQRAEIRRRPAVKRFGPPLYAVGRQQRRRRSGRQRHRRFQQLQVLVG